jgi:hypothetical protein
MSHDIRQVILKSCWLCDGIRIVANYRTLNDHTEDEYMMSTTRLCLLQLLRLARLI